MPSEQRLAKEAESSRQEAVVEILRFAQDDKFCYGGAMAGMLRVLMMWQERVVVVEWRRGLIGWLLIGLIAGWLAGKLSRGEGFGCIGDIVLGLIGSVIGGWIFSQLGIVHANTFLFSLAAATVGAVVLVSIAHLFFGGPRRG